MAGSSKTKDRTMKDPTIAATWDSCQLSVYLSAGFRKRLHQVALRGNGLFRNRTHVIEFLLKKGIKAFEAELAAKAGAGAGAEGGGGGSPDAGR